MDDIQVFPQDAPVGRSDFGDADVTQNVATLHSDFQSRLIAANLRTEAVRAGMIDLDCLKLIDLSEVRLDDHDKIVGGRQIMADLRRNKPWMFGTTSSSSVAAAPASSPLRPKTAMDMTDAEYVAARTAVIRSQF